MSDRSPSPRQRRCLQVIFGGRLAAVTVDVSEGGFCAAMPSVFLPGSTVHGTIRRKDREFPFAGVVAWAQPGDLSRGRRSRVGVRFTRAPTELLAAS